MPDSQEPIAQTKDSMVESVQREMRRRKKMLSLFLLLACIPIVVAVGVFSFGAPPPENAVDTSGLEANVREVGELAEKARRETKALSSTAERAVSEAADAKRQVERIRGETESIGRLEVEVASIKRGEIEAVQRVSAEARQAIEEARSMRDVIRENTQNLEREFNSRFERLNPKIKRKPGKGSVIRFHPDHRFLPAHFTVKAPGEVVPGDIGIVNRRGAYCGMVRVIVVSRGTAHVVAMPETVGPRRIKAGDEVIFRAMVLQ